VQGGGPRRAEVVGGNDNSGADCNVRAQVRGWEQRAEAGGVVAAGGGVSEAQLPVGVPTPALRVPAAEDGTAVRASAANGADLQCPAQIHRWQAVAHLAESAAAVSADAQAQAELGPVVEAPALRGAIIQCCAGVHAAAAEAADTAAKTQVQNLQRVAHLVRAVAPALDITQTELTARIEAPTLGQPPGGDSARVREAAAEVLHRAKLATQDRSGQLVEGRRLAGVAEAQLSEAVVAPALDASARQDCTGVEASAADANGAVPPQVDQREVITHVA